jgi:hypothetical protein
MFSKQGKASSWAYFDRYRRKNQSDPFPHSPIIYGYWVETFGPYSQNYMRVTINLTLSYQCFLLNVNIKSNINKKPIY